MSNPESITVSLEWAKKLSKCGWPEDDDMFMYVKYVNMPSWDLQLTKDAQLEDGVSVLFAAPTAEEILRRLPESLYWEGADSKLTTLRIRSWAGRWSIEYRDNKTNHRNHHENQDTLAAAAAAMWCYLAENKLLPPSK